MGQNLESIASLTFLLKYVIVLLSLDSLLKYKLNTKYISDYIFDDWFSRSNYAYFVRKGHFYA